MFKTLSVILVTLLASCTKVSPGYVGIKVNEYGDQKGVEDFPVQTGRVWYNPFTEEVYLFPTFRQNIVWTADEREESPTDESITFNSKEGAILNADIALSYKIDEVHAPKIFVEFRKGIEDITHVYLHAEVRDAFNRVASNYDAISIFGDKKSDLLHNVKLDLNNRLEGTGFHFELVSFLDAPRADRRVMEAINATIEATQRAIEAQAKIVQSKAEAEQAIEQARGESESRRLRAVAEAESIRIVAEEQAKANELVNKSLTPMMVQWKALERWDGTAPMVMGSDVMPMMQMSK